MKNNKAFIEYYTSVTGYNKKGMKYSDYAAFYTSLWMNYTLFTVNSN
ncbi:MAG: hypothetical protein ABI855_03710 [Bacteroidota bacterium]